MLTNTAAEKTSSNTRYILDGPIGHGGSAKIFRAWDSELGRYVAIKRLRADTQIDANLRKEAGILAGLQHPNVVTLFDLNADEAGVFAVLEYVNGHTLIEIADGRPMDVNAFIEMGDQICRGLAAAHSCGLIHRDLKPANIMLHYHEDQSFTVKVLDFGLARHSTEKVAEDAPLFGSIDTIAPELLLQKPADARSDIYSLGCVFYFALLGRYPYSETQDEILTTRAQKTAPPVHLYRPEIPLHISNLIQKMMALEPDARPQDIEGVRQKLLGHPTGEIACRTRHYSSAIVNPPQPVATPHALPPAPVVAAKKSKAGRWVGTAVILTALACGGAFYFLQQSSVGTKTPPPPAAISKPAVTQVSALRITTPQLTKPQAGALNTAWNDKDIGAVGLPGNFKSDPAAHSLTMNGSGMDVYTSADSFYFVYQPVRGDFTFTAHLASQQNTAAYAKAGIMIRQSMEPGDLSAFVGVSKENFAQCIMRFTQGAKAERFKNASTAEAPVWLRLERKGTSVSAYYSLDAAQWMRLSTKGLQTTDPVYLGFAVTSAKGNTLCAALFDSIEIKTK